MNIEYVARGYQSDKDINEFTEAKLRKTLKFLEEPVEIRVTFQDTRHGEVADLHVSHRFGVLQASAESPDMRDAVQSVVDKIGKQARRNRKKFIDKKRRADRVNGQHQWPVEILDRASISSTGQPRVIESSSISIKPMTIDDASVLLESSERDFVVFRDSESQKVSVLYLTKDGNYGLVSPE
jgi:putative sigma-54 modulation protein